MSASSLQFIIVSCYAYQLARRDAAADHCSSHAAGLTKVPIDGQPKSIVRELEDMARSYIKVGCSMECWRRLM